MSLVALAGDAPALNVALNVLQVAVLVALLKWVRDGCRGLVEAERRRERDEAAGERNVTTYDSGADPL